MVMQHVAGGRYARTIDLPQRLAAAVIEGRPGRRLHGIAIRTTTLWRFLLEDHAQAKSLHAAGQHRPTQPERDAPSLAFSWRSTNMAGRLGPAARELWLLAPAPPRHGKITTLIAELAGVNADGPRQGSPRCCGQRSGETQSGNRPTAEEGLFGDGPAMRRYSDMRVSLAGAQMPRGRRRRAPRRWQFKRRFSNYQPRVAHRDSLCCICRKSAGGFFLQVE
jgi:hypothetical protein